MFSHYLQILYEKQEKNGFFYLGGFFPEKKRFFSGKKNGFFPPEKNHLHHYTVLITKRMVGRLKDVHVFRGVAAGMPDHFYFLSYTKYRESIAFAQKIDFQILMNVHVLRATESKKVIFGMSSVCLSVCLSVATITKNN